MNRLVDQAVAASNVPERCNEAIDASQDNRNVRCEGSTQRLVDQAEEAIGIGLIVGTLAVERRGHVA